MAKKKSKSNPPQPKNIDPRIGQELFDELKNEPVYKNSKAFKATYQFLRYVVNFSRDQDFTSIPAKKIKEWFDSYDIKYKQCLDILGKHKLIVINRHYIVGSKTRGYRLTEKGARLMFNGQMQHLTSLFKDSEKKRRLQKIKSYHRTKTKEYKHPILQYIHDGLMRYEFSEDAVKMIEESDWGYLTKLKAVMNLTDFAQRKFVELKYNEADCRCWNEFAGMKSELRRFFRLGDLKYRYIIDIRSCHPQFLADYLINRSVDFSVSRATPVNPVPTLSYIPVKSAANTKIVKPEERERSERSSNILNTTIPNQPNTNPIPNKSKTTNSTINPIPHYDGGNSDILAELNRWNTLFSDPNTDPKTVLIEEVGYTRDQAKSALNQTINGGKQYGRFIKWFKANYPLLFAVWDRTDKAIVGVGISTFYETELMQDMDLYELADGLGLHLTYEYDGCGVMCRDDDKEVLAKIQRLIEHIQAKSERLYGIRPVIVVKTATGIAVAPAKLVQGRKTVKTDKIGVTPTQPAVARASRTAVSASQRSSSRSSPPARKRRGLSRPSAT